MIQYDLKYDYPKHTVSFWTNDDTLYDDVMKYIQNCIDATSWRNRVQEVRRIYDEECDNK